MPALRGRFPLPSEERIWRKKKDLEMTPEEMKKELLTDPLTGLGNRRAYEEARECHSGHDRRGQPEGRERYHGP